jgi:hypothetical protein
MMQHIDEKGLTEEDAGLGAMPNPAFSPKTGENQPDSGSSHRWAICWRI